MQLASKSRILFQGDSITDCSRRRDQPEDAPDPAVLGSGYACYAAASLLADFPEKQLRILNRGISGNRIVDLYARWKEETLNLQPNLLSILIGVNDTWHGFSRNAGVEVPRFERLYRLLLQETRAALPKVQLVICEPFVLPCGVVTSDWQADMKARRTVVRQLAREFKAVFVEFQRLFDQAIKHAPPAHWAYDGVHPTPAGHMLMAREWLKQTKLCS